MRKLLGCLAVGCALVQPADAQSIRFVDKTESSGLTTSIYGGFGSAWTDFNADGWPDVWIVNHMYKPGLYLNKQDGTFQNIIDSVWNGNPLLDAHGASWGDFDNDGDPDLANLSGVSGEWLKDKPFYVNREGKLVDEANARGLNDRAARGRTPSWVDWNNDGRLDLYMANYPRLIDNLSQRRLMLNKPNGQFVDAPGMKRPMQGFFAQLAHFDGHTHLLLQGGPYPEAVHRLGNPAPVAVQFSSKLTGAADVGVADFDGDLSDDLFVLRAQSLTNAYEVDQARRNVNVKLASAGTTPGTTFVIEGPDRLTLKMFDGGSTPDQVRVGSTGKRISTTEFEPFDGRRWRYVETKLDSSNPAVRGVKESQTAPGIYVGRMASGAWQVRIRRNGEFRAVIHAEDRDITHVTATGVSFEGPELEPALYMWRGNKFQDEADSRGLGSALPCDSIAVGDFDNDMDVDAYLACTTVVGNKANMLLENTGTRFVPVPDAGGARTADIGSGGSVSAVDYNNDGYLDLLVTDGRESVGYPFHSGRRYLLQNQGGTNHWIKLMLVGCQSNRDAVGARVTVTAGGRAQAKLQGGGTHNGVQDDTRVHFGLGTQTVAQSVAVAWPSGRTSTLTDLAADRIHTVEEDASCARP